MGQLFEGDYSIGHVHTVIAVLMDTTNKYKPGVQRFYLQSLVPTKNKLDTGGTVPPDTSNIMNADVGALNLQGAKIGATIELEIPKEVARWFQTKFIPPGTRFVVSFNGGDITKPRIIGRDYKLEQGGYNTPGGDISGNSNIGGAFSSIGNIMNAIHGLF